MPEKIIFWSIVILYPLIALTLVTLPFIWIKKKCKPLKWRHIFGAYFLSLVMIVGWTMISFKLDRWIVYNVQSHHWILSPLSTGTAISWLLIIFYIIISVSLVVKMKYGAWNDKRIYWTITITVFLTAFLIFIWGCFIAWSLGQLSKYL